MRASVHAIHLFYINTYFFTTNTVGMLYRLKSSMHERSMTSPLAAIGIAGGHGTFTEAQMRPSALSTGISSKGENAASRIVIDFFGSAIVSFSLAGVFLRLSEMAFSSAAVSFT